MMNIKQFKEQLSGKKEEVAKDLLDAIQKLLDKNLAKVDAHVNNLTNDVNTLIENQEDHQNRLTKLENKK